MRQASDARAILLILDAQLEQRFEPAAVRVGRPLAITPPDLGLAEPAAARQSLHALPDEPVQRSLLALAERARRPTGAPAPPFPGA